MRNALKVLFVVAFAIPTMASAAISNTKHNLSSTGPGTVKFTDAGVDMCRFCHMPHNADTTQGALWARPSSAGATAAFTPPAATAAGTALLPTLSEHAARGEAAELRRLLRRAVLALVGLTLPIMLASLVLVGPAVRFAFEGRAFTPEDPALVIAAARFFEMSRLRW